MSTARPFVIERELEPLAPGTGFNVWTERPRECDTVELRLRPSDGEPYTPAWQDGDDVVVYHRPSGRCTALLTIDGEPLFDWDDELIYTGPWSAGSRRTARSSPTSGFGRGSRAAVIG